MDNSKWKMVRLTAEVYWKLEEFRLKRESYTQAVDRLLRMHFPDQESKSESARS